MQYQVCQKGMRIADTKMPETEKQKGYYSQ